MFSRQNWVYKIGSLFPWEQKNVLCLIYSQESTLIDKIKVKFPIILDENVAL